MVPDDAESGLDDWKRRDGLRSCPLLVYPHVSLPFVRPDTVLEHSVIDIAVCTRPEQWRSALGLPAVWVL